MKLLRKQFEAGQLPESDLSAAEKQLLRVQVDKELIQHWEKVVAREESKSNLSWTKKAWGIGLAAAATLALVLYATIVPANKSEAIAKAGFVEYPFSTQNIRGAKETSASVEAKELAVHAYQNGKYTLALEHCQTLEEPFLSGMCLLHLKEYSKAREMFDQALAKPGAPVELYYYKGIALLQDGQPQAASAAFDRVVTSKEARSLWKNAAAKAQELARQ